MLVQALVAQAPVQAFDKTVLLRLAGGDVVPLDRTLLLPAQDRVRGQLGAVVRGEGRREAEPPTAALGQTASERDELVRLRRENRQLRLERDILSRATAWFARETGVLPSGSSGS